ncbi:hypothetical protein [Chelativorans sp. AA-79]|uniref:hypothetical protein n=1 Tax=Chelativorans sp. AA-79 TaxID=3028735 RepID=UPI0023F7EABE|nr:hypothetical protein [Chelativorans sp. AA-79]WEX10309.1 hypothetical protein PVE73_04945 [Chelativorans sp. AA-79]
MQPRFDERRSVYRDCRWCYGKGCLYCEAEANAEYKRQFPDGSKPIATFDMTTPEGREAAKKAIGREAIEKAFGAGGGGIAEILENIAKAKGGDDG